MSTKIKLGQPLSKRLVEKYPHMVPGWETSTDISQAEFKRRKTNRAPILVEGDVALNAANFSLHRKRKWLLKYALDL